jgi:hypothetical protein
MFCVLGTYYQLPTLAMIILIRILILIINIYFRLEICFLHYFANVK